MTYWGALRSRRFGYLWAGLVVSRLGDELTGIALLWYLLNDVGSPTAAGVAMFCMMAAAVASGFVSGTLLDRFHRGTLLLLDNLGRAAIVLAMPLLHHFGLLEVWVVCLGLALMGALSVFTDAGVRAVAPDLVAADHLDSANALESLGSEAGRILGPAAAGLLAARLGTINLLWLDATTFLFMAAMILTLPRAALACRSGDGGPRPRLSEDLVKGVRFILRQPAIRAVVLAFVVLNLGTGLQVVALPLYVRDFLGLGVAGFGLLVSAVAAGSLGGSLLVGLRRWPVPPGRGIGVALCVYGALIAGLVLTGSLAGAMTLAVLAGAATAPLNIWSVTLRQRLTPPELRGKVFSASMALARAMLPLGSALGGLLAARVPGVALVVFAGLLAVVAGVGGLLGGLGRVGREGRQGRYDL